MLGRPAFHEVRFVLKSDPAVTGGYQEYVDAGWDYSKLKLDGAPTVFRLQPMSYKQKSRFQARGNGLEQITWEQIEYAFRCGVLGVQDYMLGPDAPTRQPERTSDGLVSESWLEEVNLPSSHLAEVAAAVISISEAKLPLSVRSGQLSGAAA